MKLRFLYLLLTAALLCRMSFADAESDAINSAQDAYNTDVSQSTDPGQVSQTGSVQQMISDSLANGARYSADAATTLSSQPATPDPAPSGACLALYTPCMAGCGGLRQPCEMSCLDEVNHCAGKY